LERGFGTEVAVQRRTAQRAGYGYLCARVCCNITNLLPQRRLSDRGAGKESKQQAKTHVPNLGIEEEVVNDDADSLRRSMR
jgi:hypothetical protein